MEDTHHDVEETQPGVEAGAEAAEIELLLDLGQSLHWAALPSDRVEEHLRAVARVLGSRAEVLVLQGFLVVDSRRTRLRRISFDTHWNLGRLHELVELCEAIERGERSRAAARAELAHIMAAPEPYPRWLALLGYAVYGGVVAARVGGGALEAGVGAAIGGLAGGIHFGSIRSQRADLQKSFLAAMVSCLAVFLLSLVLPPFVAGKALFGGIALLVPAMVLTIGTHELANDALESGTARLTYGVLRLLMLGFGIAAAARLWTFFLELPPRVVAEPLPFALVVLLVAVGGLALVVCLRGRRQDMPWIVGAAVAAFATQEVTKVLFGGRGSPLLSALVLGVLARLHGRLPGKTAATVLVPGLLQLAPGFLATEAMFNLLSRGGPAADQARLLDVMMTSLQLVLGLVLADVLMGRHSGARPTLKASAQPKAIEAHS